MAIRVHVYCHVVDNHGDIGVGWRLARQLANEYSADVNLWVDDWLAARILIPQLSAQPHECRVEQVTLRNWTMAHANLDCTGDILIEAFACELPDVVIDQVAARAQKSLCINLEYLSAESWVESFHLQSGYDARRKPPLWFFIPGVTEQSGGLLRERDLLARRDTFLSENRPTTDARFMALVFTYAGAPYSALMSALETTSGATILACGKYAQAAMKPRATKTLDIVHQPFVTQPQFDELLWHANVCFVRGEDSLVRALWSGKPFVWHIYPQADDAHVPKLNAWLNAYACDFPVELQTALRDVYLAWNGVRGAPDFESAWRAIQPHYDLWRAHSLARSYALAHAPDLATRLMQFAKNALAR
jgi:uncharacterized repeat protein (TIGR03837 family)